MITIILLNLLQKVCKLMKNDAFSSCHPLTNLLFFIAAIGFSVVLIHPAYVLVSLTAACFYYALLAGRKSLRLLGSALPLCLIVAEMNPLFNTLGQTVLFTVFSRPYTLEALLYGAVIGGMLALMFLWFACYSAVLTSDKFVCLFGSLIPALSMLLVMVLRLIPNLMRKAQQLSLARRSIGKGISEQATKKENLHGGLRLLSALTDWALEGSVVTADSMRARGYGAQTRTSFQIYRLTARDGVLIALIVALSVAVIVCGGTGAEFTPVIRIGAPNLGLVAYALLLFLPPIMHIQQSLHFRIRIAGIR